MSELSEWDSFYVIVGGAAGALIGLQFVVMTLIAERPSPGDVVSVCLAGTADGPGLPVRSPCAGAAPVGEAWGERENDLSGAGCPGIAEHRFRGEEEATGDDDQYQC